MKSIRHLFAVFALALAAVFAPVAAQAQALSDWAENNIIDYAIRAQTWTLAASFDVALDTSACSDSAGGTEVTGGSYARASITRSLANWAGTQSSGSTTASSGTGGVTSNNVAINFATPTAGWGTVTHFRLMSSTNIFLCQALTTSKTINSGDTVSFPIGSITFTISQAMPDYGFERFMGKVLAPVPAERMTALA
jgi:opacity protein-like surface antigen